jgi:extracellular factor (EF) 3-hydroxypalmitic acid methyl ester biosynthesis protein
MSIQTIPLSQFVPTTSAQIEAVVETTGSFIRNLAKKGGPDQTDYPLLDSIFQQFSQATLQDSLTSEQQASIHDSFGEALSPETIQGWAYQKPLGYAGDFQIIEKIYNFDRSAVPQLAKWDDYFHAQKAPQAVRNRLSFFLDQLWKTKMENPSATQVLNVASGPGRDMYEALQVMGASDLKIDCVDQDHNAIDFAKNLCGQYLHNINFTHKNIFRFSTNSSYHLIWSAGLFDYFNDNLFKRTILKLSQFLKPNGRMVIGNFSPENPSRGYMELCDWKLIHRSQQHLQQLAKECGFEDHQIRVEQESEGINLFLVLTK